MIDRLDSFAFLFYSSWVLVAINIRKQTKFWNTYSRIDPSFLVASIFAVFWYPFGEFFCAKVQARELISP